ncbi:MAG: hypothetical protein PWR22_334 [Moorella sp. (in: firmicutes)]|nr:hypothetical protein [Moorella sp. (in: firmicutes)]
MELALSFSVPTATLEKADFLLMKAYLIEIEASAIMPKVKVERMITPISLKRGSTPGKKVPRVCFIAT